MKKILRLCSMLLIVSLLLTVPAFAAEILYSGTCGGEGDGSNLTWTLDDQGTLTISGSGKMKDFYGFSPWYDYRTSIKTVSICDGVTSIGSYAFEGCSRLTSVTIPEGVTSIGNDAFDVCSGLTVIQVDSKNNNYSSDERGALFDKKKTVLIQYPIGNIETSYAIPEGVTSIGDYAFRNCRNLTSVTIPKGVTSIDDSAFAGCSSLTSVTIPEGVTSIGDSAFFFCSSLTSVTIPESVTSIGSYAFSYCRSLTSVTIPEGVTSIGNDAFYYCRSLTSVTIPESVTRIGNFAFSHCSSLTSVTIPEGVTRIGYYAFRGCSSLTSVTIPASVTSIGDYAFQKCSSLTSATIPEGVTSIGDHAFYDCSSLTAIQVDSQNNNYSSDERGALFDKKKTVLIQYPIGNTETSYAIPESVTSIGSDAFYDCSSLTSVTIPEGVTNIGDSAFSGFSSLTSVTIPEDVTNIGSNAFEFCRSLTSVTIPESVTSIGTYAFYACESLKDVYYTGSQEQWNAITFGVNNHPLLKATIHYHYALLSVRASDTASGRAYSVSACNLPTSSTVMVALYSGGGFVGLEKAIYNGETLVIETQTAHDFAKIMAWESLGSLTPLTPAVTVSKK